MRFHKLLPCFCVSVLSIAVSAIQTSTSISSSAPTALSLSTPAIEKSAPLFIDTSGRPPDIIGISQVSSWYGPGSWSIWLITLCGSWLHIFVDHDKSPIDLNTWSYLAYAQWASIDLILRIYSIRRLKLEQGSDDWKQESVSIGAALTIVLWTILHGVSQFIVCTTRSGAKLRTQDLVRATSLFVGLALPAFSLVFFRLGLYGFELEVWSLVFPASAEIEDVIPA